MSVLILHDELPADARADELDVLEQAAAVAAALSDLGVAHRVMAFGKDLGTTVAGIRAALPDVVFNLVESVARQTRLSHVAPALLDGLDQRYTGSGAAALLLTASKLSTKRALRAAGLPTPPAWTLPQLRTVPTFVPGRFVLKSVWEHGSIGLEADAVVSAADADALAAALRQRLPALAGEGFAETYVHGREFNVAMLEGRNGPECLPIAEIRFQDSDPQRPRIVGYRAKWHPGSEEDVATPRGFDFGPQDGDLLARLRRLAEDTWRACDLRGYARVDFRIDRSGEPTIVDVNANPCLSPGAGFAAMLERAGLSFPAAVRRILDAALSPRDDSQR